MYGQAPEFPAPFEVHSDPSHSPGGTSPGGDGTWRASPPSARRRGTHRRRCFQRAPRGLLSVLVVVPTATVHRSSGGSCCSTPGRLAAFPREPRSRNSRRDASKRQTPRTERVGLWQAGSNSIEHASDLGCTTLEWASATRPVDLHGHHCEEGQVGAIDGPRRGGAHARFLLPRFACAPNTILATALPADRRCCRMR